MKTSLIILNLIAIITVGNTALGAECKYYGTPTQASGCPYTEQRPSGANCSGYIKKCYENGIFTHCFGCQGKGIISVKTYTDPIYSNCTVTYNTCECPACEGNCSPSKPYWYAASTGYEMRDTATCNCGECVKGAEYRCAAGYYGSPKTAGTGCTKCPSSGGVAGQSAAGSTTITSCYIPSGSSFSDSTGSGTYTGNCYYKL